MKNRRDELYLYDILECCRKIENYLSGVSSSQFWDSPMLQDALVRNIEIIGEAAKNISSETRDMDPEISWREIARMRDKIVHHYFRLNLEVIWQTVTVDVPLLRSQIERIYREIARPNT